MKSKIACHIYWLKMLRMIQPWAMSNIIIIINYIKYIDNDNLIFQN